MTDFVSDPMLEAITRTLRAECEQIVAEEAEAASQRVRDRMAKLAPRAVMEVFRHFEVSRAADTITIRVRNDLA